MQSVRSDKFKAIVKNFSKFATNVNFVEKTISEIFIKRMITDDELEDLHKIFLFLDVDYDGSINLEDFIASDEHLGKYALGTDTW